MSVKYAASDIHFLDPFIKRLASRWILVALSVSAVFAGYGLSVLNADWSYINRFGAVVIVAGLFLTMSPIFSNGIYRSQSGVGTLGGLTPDNEIMTTTLQDRKVGGDVVLGMAITIFGTLMNAFGDLLFR
jgi:hypothetical protein